MSDTQTTPIEEKDLQSERLELVLANVENKEGIIKMVGEKDLPCLRTAKKQITSFKRRFSPDKLQPKGVDDKAGIEKLKDARREMRKTRTALEDERTEIVDPHNDFVKKINGVYKPLVEEMKTIEAAAKKVDDEMEEAIEKEKQRVAREEEERINSRVDVLIKAGCVFDNGYYCAGSEEFQIPIVSIGIVDLKAMSNELFEKILSEIKEKVDAVNLAIAEKKQREAEAKAKQEEEDRLAKQKFDEQQAELKRQQEEFQKQQAEFKRQQEELAAKQKWLQEAQEKEEQRKQIQEQARIQSVIDKRKAELVALGLTEHPLFSSWMLGEEVIVNSGHVLDTEFNWDAFMKVTTPEVQTKIQQLKDKAEEELRAEQKRIADKAIENKRLADLAEEKRKAEELAKSSDSTKWAAFLEYLSNTPILEMESEEYKAKYKNALAILTAIK